MVRQQHAVRARRIERLALLMIGLNFGCGTNRIEGWKNFDAEINIEKPLPFPGRHADFIFAEHVVEHVDYYSAIRFFKEALRVLKSGGVFRIVVPSIEQIQNCVDPAYYKFASKWGLSADVRGAMFAILYAHGHKTAWTASLMSATLFYAGFDQIQQREPHLSDYPELCYVEGHHKVIGDKFNAIESLVFEATKS
jgi:SAM-dependent methyltransferase